MRQSFGEILRANGGIGHGFDFARVALSLSVLFWHELEIVTGQMDFLKLPGVWIVHSSVLPMFFGLSGFLVAGSAQRLSLSNFAINRGLRIVPALAVEISLSAILIGPLVSSLSPSQYFSDGSFWTYLLNILGLIHYRLPGVFENNPIPFVVNASLWTVPFEIACYIIMAALVVTGLVRRSASLVGVALLAALSAVAIENSTVFITSPTYAHFVAMFLREGQGPPLIPCFLLGSAAFAFRDRIMKDARIAMGCVSGLALISFAVPAASWHTALIATALCPMMVYLVCYIGLSPMPRLPFFSTGDYSYGIYLYGYPIQQTVVHFFPGQAGSVHAIASTALTILFASFSWHVIEKPILGIRKGFSFAARSPHIESRSRLNITPPPVTVNEMD